MLLNYQFVVLNCLFGWLVWFCLFPVIQRRNVIRMQSDNEDSELKQVRDMAAARKRWEALVIRFVLSFTFVKLSLC